MHGVDTQNSLPTAAGDAIKSVTIFAPVLIPFMVIALPSPRKDPILSFTHVTASSESFRPRFPGIVGSLVVSHPVIKLGQ